MLIGVTSWELGVLRVPLIMVPDTIISNIYEIFMCYIFTAKEWAEERFISYKVGTYSVDT
jgi:Na+/glutamate symporter